MPLDSQLHKSANKGDLAVIMELIEVDGVDINALGANDRTPLHRAAGSGCIDVVSYLLQNGAELNALDKYKRTPLFWACTGGHTKTVDLLLRSGATPMVTTTTGTTAFMAAVESGNIATVEVILSWIELHPETFSFATLCCPDDSEGKKAYSIALQKDKAIAKLIKTKAPQCVPNTRFSFLSLKRFSFTNRRGSISSQRSWRFNYMFTLCSDFHAWLSECFHSDMSNQPHSPYVGAQHSTLVSVCDGMVKGKMARRPREMV